MPSIDYSQLEREEIEELEVQERGVGVNNFRELVGDVFIKAYFLFTKFFKNDGGILIF